MARLRALVGFLQQSVEGFAEILVVKGVSPTHDTSAGRQAALHRLRGRSDVGGVGDHEQAIRFVKPSE
jgi:hypothetical protein